ncbi:MAG: hypothetical protein VCG02_06960 [Verrucomicrobiota bacterium]
MRLRHLFLLLCFTAVARADTWVDAQGRKTEATFGGFVDGKIRLNPDSRAPMYIDIDQLASGERPQFQRAGVDHLIGLLQKDLPVFAGMVLTLSLLTLAASWIAATLMGRERSFLDAGQAGFYITVALLFAFCMLMAAFAGKPHLALVAGILAVLTPVIIMMRIYEVPFLFGCILFLAVAVMVAGAAFALSIPLQKYPLYHHLAQQFSGLIHLLKF